MTRRAWLAFALASVIWGVPYLFIKIAVDHGVTAPALAWGRVTLGAVVLLALAWRAGTLASVRDRCHGSCGNPFIRTRFSLDAFFGSLRFCKRRHPAARA